MNADAMEPGCLQIGERGATVRTTEPVGQSHIPTSIGCSVANHASGCRLDSLLIGLLTASLRFFLSVAAYRAAFLTRLSATFAHHRLQIRARVSRLPRPIHWNSVVCMLAASVAMAAVSHLSLRTFLRSSKFHSNSLKLTSRHFGQPSLPSRAPARTSVRLAVFSPSLLRLVCSGVLTPRDSLLCLERAMALTALLTILMTLAAGSSRTATYRLRTLVVAGVVAASSSVAQASCGSAFCLVNTNWGAQGVWTEPGWRGDLRYEYINQDQPRAGTQDVSVGQIPGTMTKCRR